MWVAPPAGSGCVIFKATVIEHRDVWYSDDGALNRGLCEDDADSGDHQPMQLEECTACEEAKYELTFEGLWSRQTHPKDFPANVWLTKFTDVIGASHKKNYTVWAYGQPATPGLKQLVEHGSTTELESELKANVSSSLMSFSSSGSKFFISGLANQNDYQSPRNRVSKRDGENFCRVPCRLRASFGLLRLGDISSA